MKNQAFFEPNLQKVLKPIIWVDTKFEQNGKTKNSIELWRKTESRSTHKLHDIYLVPEFNKKKATLAL